MAKCPVCRGKGYRLRIDDMRFAMAEIVKCESCDGKGVVEPLTEQEYIQTCNHKELTEILFRMIVHGSVIRPDRQYISEWLKQPHTKE